MSNINTDLVRLRLRDIRKEKKLLLHEASRRIGLPPEELYALENGLIPITAQHVIQLSNSYDVQLYELTNAPLPYHTPDELLQAFHEARITEGVLAHELHVDRLNTRQMYIDYLERTGQER